MAGDWIKMRINLDTNPHVLAIAADLGLHPLHVVGMLWKVWAWADSHSLDGNALRVTDVTLDRFVDRTGFALSLRKVGWLEGRDGLLTFPRFAEHNGQTAKKRAETQERVSRHRNANRVTDVTQKALPEKRREEKRREDDDASRVETGDPPATGPPESSSLFPNSKKFAAAWSEWLRYRMEKGKPLTATSIAKQFRIFAEWEDPEIACLSIDQAIAGGFLALAKPPAGKGGKTPDREPTDAELEERARAKIAENKKRLFEP